ncbi:iron ABC transporter permease [Pigmentiphaga aceris]|uniref:Iron ABC transporter permease n=1 Tax=Pigmentiphaga aceris TaxID=1940612 RepID=A0A5C0B4N9_9BURK|nr:iron ABC transporter permease [Pigmentiphaga aceris]QEI09582.1 iron ABC transporter permease [Pigmentiphaga aceris]
MVSPRRALAILGVLLLAAFASLVVAAAVGSVAIAPRDWWPALHDAMGTPATLFGTLVDLRVTRALSAMATGASLALAGLLLQALLRNPLADPYVLGVSGGASVGALAAMLFALTSWHVDLAAFAGAAIATLLLFALARDDFRAGPAGGAPLLLLTGVVLASGCGALVTLMLSVAPEGRLRGMVFWLIGDLSGAQARWLPWVAVVLALVLCMARARAINLIAMVSDHAVSLGVNVPRLRVLLFLCAAGLTASAVTTAGSIGFLGLIVPHACRFALGPDHRLLIPASALAGGTFLVLADTAARSIVAPMQLPVGVITALIGVPAFLLQLRHIRKVQR